MSKNRGVLLHISSLPSPYGIGTLGRQAYGFADFLNEKNQNLWQILPINPTAKKNSDSPYSPLSVFAFNPYFIDLDMLSEEGLIEKSILRRYKWQKKYCLVDYALINQNREKILYECYMNFNVCDDDYKDFCKQNSFWLEDYALFSAIKKHNGLKEWSEWEKDLRFRNNAKLEVFKSKNGDKVEYEKVIQYLFYGQWKKLKNHCNSINIKLIGDMPIYAAYDSSDVWANPKVFQLNKNLLPKFVAGVPPDQFTSEGQLWGNPVYDWKYIASTDYLWWKNRFKQAIQLYDIIRIDHFRGFESYYKIPYGDKNAIKGFWEKGPGKELFNSVKEQTDKITVIAEDLGYLTKEVKQMLKDTGFPGMKILQFAFNGNTENEHLPHNYKTNHAVYTGTHDNNTAKGWYKSLNKKQKNIVNRYLNIKPWQSPVKKLIKAALSSSADYAIIPMQDYLNLGQKSRMNTPATVKDNWQWRLKKGYIHKYFIKEN